MCTSQSRRGGIGRGDARRSTHQVHRLQESRSTVDILKKSPKHVHSVGVQSGKKALPITTHIHSLHSQSYICWTHRNLVDVLIGQPLRACTTSLLRSATADDAHEGLQPESSAKYVLAIKVL